MPNNALNGLNFQYLIYFVVVFVFFLLFIFCQLQNYMMLLSTFCREAAAVISHKQQVYFTEKDDDLDDSDYITDGRDKSNNDIVDL